MPDYETIDLFDRALGKLVGAPHATATKPTTHTTHTSVVGAGQTFTVQTFRERHEKDTPHGLKVWTEDTIFITYIDAKGSNRFVLPFEVADTIARQREALTTRNRKKAALSAAETRKASGATFGFAAMTPKQRAEARKKAKATRAAKAAKRAARLAKK